jgi:hypothetical protein
MYRSTAMTLRTKGNASCALGMASSASPSKSSGVVIAQSMNRAQEK